MATTTIKLSKLLEPQRNKIENINSTRNSRITEKIFDKDAQLLFNNLKKNLYDPEIQINQNLKKKIIVISHERSGTHFLMNAIAYNSDYSVSPFIPCAGSTGINFFNKDGMKEFFSIFKNIKISNIYKSHHHFNFLKKNLDELKDDYFFLYIYRDPRDVFYSFWNFLKTFPDTGPLANTISEFLTKKPEGKMLQFQTKHYENILERWEDHINCWVLNEDKEIKENIKFIKYEDLNKNYNTTLKEIFDYLEIKLLSNIKPSATQNVLVPGRGKIGTYKFFLNNKDLNFIDKKIGETMKKLNYNL